MIKQLIDFTESLKSKESIEIEENLKQVRFNLKDKETIEWSRDRIANKFGITLDENVMKVSNIKVKWEKSWRTEKRLFFLYGGFKFSIYNSLLGFQTDFILQNPLKHPSELVEKLFPFSHNEIELNHGSKGVGCFFREHGKWPLDIYLFDSGVRIKMDMTLEAYIQALIDSCAIAYWQYFYVNVDELVEQNQQLTSRHGYIKGSGATGKSLDEPRIKYLVKMLSTFVKYLPQLFPNKDFSYHIDRLKQIEDKAKPYL